MRREARSRAAGTRFHPRRTLRYAGAAMAEPRVSETHPLLLRAQAALVHLGEMAAVLAAVC